MILTLLRQPSWHATTLGVLFHDGERECYTLEDQVRHAAKVPGETAIPAGRYRVRMTWSDRFGCPMPLVEGVPGFEGIRIHPGNTAADTEGCILVADRVVDAGRVAESRVAYKRLVEKIAEAGECWLEVVDAAAAAAEGAPVVVPNL